MKTACLAMIRNEEFIIQAFLDQTQEFFDYIYIIDHSSTDKTLDFIRSRYDPRIHIFHLQAQGHPQSELSNAFVELIHQRHDVDHIVILDADEFLPFNKREDFHDFLIKRNHFDAIHWHWRNILPLDINTSHNLFTQPFNYDPNIKSDSTKVILNKKLLNKKNWQLPQGNHFIISSNPSITILEEQEHYLLHIPIQSITRFFYKIVSGSLRLTADQIKIKNGLGIHWKNFNDILSRLGPSEDFIKSIAYNYPYTHNSTNAKNLDFQFPYVKPQNHKTVKEEITTFLISIMQQSKQISHPDEKINLIEEHCRFYKKDEYSSFNGTIYLINNPDVLSSDYDPFLHYIRFGKLENRKPH